MQLHIIAIGHKMPDWINTGFEEFTKRMPPELRIVLREIKPELRSGSKTAATVMHIEAQRIETALPKAAFIVALDERGRDLTTIQWAQHLERWKGEGRDIALIIGGADGLDASIKNRADLLLRLSSLTLPHGLVRIVLAEQLYRAWSISQGHPYHRV